MNSPVDIRTNNFDLLRLLAATQVVFIHGVDHLGLRTGATGTWMWLVHAFPGVPIFFAISGFLISLAYERSPSLTMYLRNRALRIFPALWLCFGVSVLVVALLADLDWATIGAGRVSLWVIAQLSIVQFYNPDWLRGFGVGVLNGSLWTIPVEMQFYVLVPVVYGTLRLRSAPRNGALFVLLAIFWGISRFYIELAPEYGTRLWYKLAGVTFAPYFYLFIAGMLLQRNWARISGALAGRGPLWLTVYMVVATAMHHFGLRVGTNTPDPWGVPFLLIAVLSLAYTRPTTSDTLLRRNDISYGVYIYHMLVVNAMIALGFVNDWPWLIPMTVATYLLAAISWTLVERRALARKRSTVHAVTGAVA